MVSQKAHTFILTFLMLAECTGIIVYDCDDHKTNITAISIRDVMNCPEPESAYSSVKNNLKVIQRNEIRTIQVRTCLIEVTRMITHCGMHSHSSVVAGGLSNFVYRLGADECFALHRYRSIQLYQQNIGDIVMNGTTSVSMTIAGAVGVDGSCKGTIFHEQGQTWTDVVITASIKIQARDYLARVKMEENLVHLNGGVTCPFLAEYCFDTMEGEYVWKNGVQITCEDKLSLLYKGIAEIVKAKTNGERYVVIESGDKIFALTLIKRGILCQSQIWQTEHPRIIVWLEEEGNALDPVMEISPYNTDLMDYVNSKFLYVEQANKRNLEKLYLDTIYRRCLVHREVLKNRLMMAPLAPTLMSQLVQSEGGYIGRVLGEVLYIMKCIPKSATIRRTGKCYNELPIEINNQTKFMAPVTRIIQDHAEEIECNGLIPPLYFIDNDWIGLAPHPTVKAAPKELEVEKYEKLNFSPILPIGSAGLYTQEEVHKAQKLLTFGSERKAVENIIARRVAGLETAGQGFSTLKMFNPQEMKKLARSTMKHLWGWFTDIGMFVSGLIGFYVIFRAVKYIIGVVINSLQLYKTVGCSLTLLASLWNTLTMWVMHRHQLERMKQPSADTNDRERSSDYANTDNKEDVETSAARVTSYPNLNAAKHWTETN